MESYCKNENQESSFEDLAAQMYFDEKDKEDKNVFFSLSVFQTVVCIILTAIVFFMAFSADFKEKIVEATDYFQSFELTKEDIKGEIEAMKEFLNGNEI